ncbi:MAG TPA: decarboxylase, partial [Candidatus Xenobia bacterium]
ANTPGDVHAALAAGVPASAIVYSGTNLNAVDLAYLEAHDIRMNLDSLDQLRSLPPGAGEVGCRFLIDDPERPNRIGITAAELPEAVALAAQSGRRLTGLHMYAGTNTRRISRFVDGLDRLLTAAATVPDLQYVDLGGGYGVPYRDGQQPLDLSALGRVVGDRMDALSLRLGRRIALWLEPGRYLVAASGVLLTTVVSAKIRGGRRYVGVDSTVGNIAVPSVYHPQHRLRAVSPRGEPLPVPTDVCGNTTHSRDFLARGVALPELMPGDLLALQDVGAYGYATSSHFLNRPRPAEVVLDRGREILATRRETLDDLLATQVRT